MNSEPEASNLSPASGEFASKEWLAYLVKNKIGFRLRIKANTLITDKGGRRIHASKMLKTMKIGERAELRRRRRLWNQSVFVAVCRKEDGDNVIIVSSERSGEILLEYGQRWQIADPVRMPENQRISARRHAFNARRKNKQLVIVIDVGDSLGTTGR
jgi:hypothetical protein